MTEPLSQNNHALNQRAKKLLKSPDPEMLYLIQVLIAELEYAMGDPLTAEMYQADPKLVMEAILETDLKPEELEMDPYQAAQQIAEAVGIEAEELTL